MLTPDERAEWRRAVAFGPSHGVNINSRTLLALLDAADERDRLAAAIEEVQKVVNGPAAYLRVTASGLHTKVVNVNEIIRALDGQELT